MTTEVTATITLTHKEATFLKNLYNEITTEIDDDFDWNDFMWAVAHNNQTFMDCGQRIILACED